MLQYIIMLYIMRYADFVFDLLKPCLDELRSAPTLCRPAPNNPCALVSSYPAPLVRNSRSHSEGLSLRSRGKVATWLESEQHEKAEPEHLGAFPKRH